jgi:hypothetical protein
MPDGWSIAGKITRGILGRGGKVREIPRDTAPVKKTKLPKGVEGRSVGKGAGRKKS